MKLIIIRYVWVAALLVLFIGTAEESRSQGIYFIENQGQWNDTIRYKAGISNGALFLTDQGLVYNFMHPADIEAWHDQVCDEKDKPSITKEVQLRHHAYKVNFVSTQPKKVNYEGQKKLPYHHNYFLGKDSNKWQSHVDLYQQIRQENIYPGIDLVIYNDTEGAKYDFIVTPGTDPSQIILEYEGVQPRVNKKGDLELITTVNKVIEKAPLVYQEIDGERRVIPSRYKVVDNSVSFELLGPYNNRFPLIIDPSLVFATYSGAPSGTNTGYSSTYDNTGNMYAGAKNLVAGWPTTVGAFQTSSAGSTDITINKYNPSGSVLLFSTYLGGNAGETPAVLMINSLSELIIAGSTTSINFPTTTNCFDSSLNGGRDFFITKLTNDGSQLIASTYVGSSWDEHVPEFTSLHISIMGLAMGENNSIWIASNIAPIPGPLLYQFPITPNAFQPNYGGGNTDGILFQIDNNLTDILYSSYLGGNSSDVCVDLITNSEGHLITCGISNSENLMTTTGVLHPAYVGGQTDGFIAVIDPQNDSLLALTYLGTNEEDNALKLQVDEYDNILALGRTMGAYPISPSVYHLPGTDHFIDKISPDLKNSILSTRLGAPQTSSERFEPAALLYDYCGRTYISGFNGSPNLPTTTNAIQTWGGVWNGVLETNFSGLYYATYFGIPGDHFHSGINRFDPYGVIYQTICGGSPNYPTSNNAVFPNKTNGSGLDAISFKIDLEAEFVETAIILPAPTNDSGCAPYTVTFTNNTYCPFPVEFTWDFGDGSPIDTNASPTHTFTDPGVYTVILKATSPLSCNFEDTDTLTISVFLDEGPDIFTNDTIICQQEETLELWVGINNPQSSYVTEWGPFNALLSDRHEDTILVDPNLSNQFWVQVQDTTGFCAISFDTITVGYYPRALDILNHDTLLCLGDTLQIQATGSEGYDYQWSPLTGISDDTTLEPYIIAQESRLYTLTTSHPYCPDTSDQFFLQVDNPTQADFDVDPTEVCVGRPVFLYPKLDSTLLKVAWELGDQFRSESIISKRYQHAFDQPGTFPLTLTSTYRVCPESTFTDSIKVYPYPEVDLGTDSSICLDGSALYLKNLREATDGSYHYLWSTGDTTTILKVVHPGRYTLSATTEPIGCTTTESVKITKDCYTDVPNAFTPNGDGNNDYFFPRQLLSRSVNSFRMQIFNRWGQLIFETTNLDGRGWDGRFNDKAQPMGVYLYRIEVGFTNGREEQYEGNVTLIR